MLNNSEKTPTEGSNSAKPLSEEGDPERRPPCFVSIKEKPDSYLDFLKKRIRKAREERDSPTLIFIQDLLMLEGMEMLSWKQNDLFKQFTARDELVQSLDGYLLELGKINKGGGIVFDSGEPIGETPL
jgi:hypothetical protein